MKHLSLLLILLNGLSLTAQIEVDWDRTYGGSNEDLFYHAIQASNGNIIAVGETASNAQGGLDGFLQIIDHYTGDPIVEKRIGGKKKDGFTSVVQTLDGHFLLAGFTESIGEGKRDGWLVKIDEQGNLVWEATYGTAKDDGFNAMVYLPKENSIILSGIRESQKDGDIWLLKIKEGEIRWESTIGQGHFKDVKGMTLSRDQGVVLIGNTQKSKKSKDGNIYLLKAKPNGQLDWERFFGEKAYEEGLDVVATKDGGYALTGLTTSKTGNGKMDIWLLKTFDNGQLQWDEKIGGQDDDLANAIIETEDQGFILVGQTNSHRKAARQSKLWAVKTDKGGRREWVKDFGDKKEDAGLLAANLYDGSLLLGGRTESKGNGGNDAWLLRIKDRATYASLPEGVKDLLQVEINNSKVNTFDGLLKPNDYTYLSLDLQNKGNLDLTDIQIRVDNAASISGMKLWRRNYAGTLKRGASKTVNIPIQGDENLASGQYEAVVTILSGSTEIASKELSIGSKKPKAAKVNFADYNFQWGDYNSEVSNTAIELTVELQNTGDYPTEDLEIAFGYPKEVLKIDDSNRKIGKIGPNETKNVTFRFYKLESDSTKRDITISTSVKEKGRIKYNQPMTVEVDKPRRLASGSGGRTTIASIEPDEGSTNLKNLKAVDQEFNIKSVVISKKPVDSKNIKVRLNGVVMEDNKLGEKRLRKARNNGNSKFVQTLNTLIFLQEGQNTIEIEVTDENGETALQTWVVDYEPRLPNLHLISIGPSHDDLKYTRKDAEDFANAFRNQQGRLFENVYINKLNLPENTNRQRIQEAIADLVYQYKNYNASPRIFDKDVILVFVSSHGKKGQSGFKLLPTGYNPKYEDQFAIDYKSDIVDPLSAVNCKKLIFLDACHSGAAGSGSKASEFSQDTSRSRAVFEINRTQPGLSTITSCSQEQMSYEDDAWQNGAFTEAMLDALANKEQQDTNGSYAADADGNKTITVSELYQYIQRRVPQLMQEQKPNAPTPQIPFMPAGQLNEDMPVYRLR